MPMRYRDSVQDTLNALQAKLEGGNIKPRKIETKSKSQELYEMQAQKKAAEVAYSKFNKQIREDLLFESICKIYKPTLRKRTSPRTDSLADNLVKEFIRENGNINALLNKYKKESLLLSEMVSVIEEYIPIILERVDPTNPNTFNVDTEVRDDFFNSLDGQEFDKISTVLNQRIASAMDDFVMDNIQTKAEIREVIQQTKERIDTKKDISDELTECYNMKGRKMIHDIKNNRPKTILNSIVYNISEAAMKNKDLNNIYTDVNGKLDMDMIVDESLTIYSFLETVNTCKLARVNTEYITNFLNSFKC